MSIFLQGRQLWDFADTVQHVALILPIDDTIGLHHHQPGASASRFLHSVDLYP